MGGNPTNLLKYIEPTLEQMQKGLWIGTRALGNSKMTAMFVNNGKYPIMSQQSLFHASLCLNGIVYQVSDKDNKNHIVKITKKQINNALLKQFYWHQIKQFQGQGSIDELVQQYQKDHKYSLQPQYQHKQMNCQTFCVRCTAHLLQKSISDAIKLIKKAIDNSYTKPAVYHLFKDYIPQF